MGFDYAGKIRALLANAENEALSEDARATFRAKAFDFMRRYNIAEEQAIAVDPTCTVPTAINIEFRDTSFGKHRYHMLDMLRHICQHTGTRYHASWMTGGIRLTIVGYEGDLRYTEFLWTSAHLMFATRLMPEWQDDRTEAENVFFLRNAGQGRKEIANRAWGNGAGDQAKNRSKVQRMYLAEAARRGEEARATGLGFNGSDYADAYAESFVYTLARRLRAARDAANSVHGAVELPGRMDRVSEAFDELFPPAPKTEVKPYVAPNADCVPCSKAKTTCNDHAYLRTRSWTQADERRLVARQNSSSRAAGAVSGATAAEGVIVSRGHTTASRLDASGTAIEG